ncbi:MAG: hypothetical protein FRX49_03027 [Trebouxia sp. A1-2]|nr:MAG: hypothetical protein FRX49_03027 [Trebouxia sp. A1-2]
MSTVFAAVEDGEGYCADPKVITLFEIQLQLLPALAKTPARLLLRKVLNWSYGLPPWTAVHVPALLPLLSMELLLTGVKTMVKFSEAVQLVFELS